MPRVLFYCLADFQSRNPAILLLHNSIIPQSPTSPDSAFDTGHTTRDMRHTSGRTQQSRNPAIP